MTANPLVQTPDAAYLQCIENVDFEPIFIMGDHRSGTTLLYKLLVATQSFNYVNAYHIIKYQECLSNHINHHGKKAFQALAERFISHGIVDRGFDHIEVTPDLPEEYGFILRNAGYESYINAENLALFIELCKKVQFISQPQRPLLLKNPWCFPHFLYIKSVFPRAKFIFIHRHPVHVINSKLRAVRTFLKIWNPYTSLISKQYRQIFESPLRRSFYQFLYASHFNLGLRRVTRQSIESTTYFLQNIDALSPTDYISVRYEDLCQTPESTLLNIMTFLGQDNQIDPNVAKQIKPRPPNLFPEVQKNCHHIKQQLKHYVTDQGYDA